ncbi:hypothetical protein EKK58_09195 [Candidatus Dependentiae bacterium]|nr:MAG: hypothetical protein EKK58_09195 [Candidatus Dependentiae bacterium]
MSELNYYIGQIGIRHGEYEFTNTFRFTLPAHQAPLAFVEDYAKTYYGDDDVEDEGNYFSHNAGDLATWPDDSTLVTKEVFDAMTMLPRHEF